MEDPLRIWTLYDHPKDYPQGYVVRQWVVTAKGEQPTATIIQSDAVDKIEAFMAECYPGLTWIPRSENDDPVIMGTWL